VSGRPGAHLARCETCAARVDAARSALEAARLAAGVPEPSPLFWDHLSARVRRATAAEPVPKSRVWPFGGRTSLLAGALAAAVVLAAVVLRQPEEVVVPTAARTVPTGEQSESALADETSDVWDDVLALVSDLSSDDVHDLAPWPAGPVGLLAELTPAERDAFAALIEREMTDE
jgi:hypothetical protein